MNNYMVIILTILFSGFFSGLEIAFVSVNKLKVEIDKGKGKLSSKVISRFLAHPSRFIGAMLLGNNIALVIYGIAAAALLEPLIIQMLPTGLNSNWVVLLIQTVVSTLIILVTAEFLPKMLFRLNPNGLLNLFAIPALLVYVILSPLMFLFLGIAEFILKKLGFSSVVEPYRFSAIDFNEYLKDIYQPSSEKEEEVPEIQMIQNVLEFHTTKVRECMVPRNEIIAVSEQTPIEEIQSLFIESKHSKIPVYKETIDNITGYIHVHDLFKKPETLTSIVRPVIAVPETIAASDLLNMMIKQRRSVAVIFDEFGGTAGMITTEDLIEEIFGEIDDEFDEDEFAETQLNKNEFEFSGRLEIDYINQTYGLNIPESDEYETLAGYIISHVHDIPKIDDQIEIDKFSFIILEASDTRIDKILVRIK